MIESLLQLSLVAIIIMSIAYVVYMIGLSLVFRELGARSRLAFVPLYNYYVLIQAVGLPRNWFIKAIIPYAGTLYAIAISVRLGKIYGRNFAFSSVWLTIGAPIGMLIITNSKQPRHFDVVKQPTPRIRKKPRPAEK